MNEKSGYIQLTDGGHFENLGIYELIRRELKVIIVCDGAADPEFTFQDLANAAEKVRVDFGAQVSIDSTALDQLIPKKKKGKSIATAMSPFIIATIHYASGREGTLIYLKTTCFEKYSSDLFGYKMAHPEFPDQPTSDQFFGEKQFEAYRELGYMTTKTMINSTEVSNTPTIKSHFP